MGVRLSLGEPEKSCEMWAVEMLDLSSVHEGSVSA